MKSARRRSRELVVQGLYQWQVGGQDCSAIIGHLATQPNFLQADQAFFSRLLEGVMESATTLDDNLRSLLDRPLAQISPVERAILWLAAYELIHFPETPFRVIVNEAIDLAKRYGATDGHKYINGVLDRLASRERPHERRRSPVKTEET
ncbi:MAG: transcription antitermination factor NusB [Ferrovum sp.]|nr:transcription antitermination factor NusB [Ferrovum sp.]NDU87708.1 transcription antitermination factor NusB [Ferrovum sp.]